MWPLSLLTGPGISFGLGGRVGSGGLWSCLAPAELAHVRRAVYTRAHFPLSMGEETGTHVALSTWGVGAEAVSQEGPCVARKVGLAENESPRKLYFPSTCCPS